MTQPQYIEVTVLTHTEAGDGLADLLLSLGAKGVVEEGRAEGLRLTAYLLSDDARNVTGTMLYVDAGYHAMGM